MKLRGQEFYVFGQSDFNKLLAERIRGLENGLAMVLVEQVEMAAVSDAIRGQLTEEMDQIQKNIVARMNDLAHQVNEFRTRIDALRGLSGEFDEPKVE